MDQALAKNTMKKLILITSKTSITQLNTSSNLLMSLNQAVTRTLNHSNLIQSTFQNRYASNQTPKQTRINLTNETCLRWIIRLLSVKWKNSLWIRPSNSTFKCLRTKLLAMRIWIDTTYPTVRVAKRLKKLPVFKRKFRSSNNKTASLFAKLHNWRTSSRCRL